MTALEARRLANPRCPDCGGDGRIRVNHDGFRSTVLCDCVKSRINDDKAREKLERDRERWRKSAERRRARQKEGAR